MDLTAEQKAQTQRTMVLSIRTMARFAFAEEDYPAQIRHLEEAVALEPREYEAAELKVYISQAYRLLEQWPECIQYTEEAIDVIIENRPNFAVVEAVHLAECHQKSGNFEQARHWIATSVDIARGMETKMFNEKAWEQQISRLESALTDPDDSSE